MIKIRDNKNYILLSKQFERKKYYEIDQSAKIAVDGSIKKTKEMIRKKTHLFLSGQKNTLWRPITIKNNFRNKKLYNCKNKKIKN